MQYTVALDSWQYCTWQYTYFSVLDYLVVGMWY